MLYCAKCGSEWEGETVAMNPAYDTPAARAGSLAGDYKRDCAVAIEDLNRAVYALEKLAADSEIARNALALVALQLDIVRDKAALAALAIATRAHRSSLVSDAPRIVLCGATTQ